VEVHGANRRRRAQLMLRDAKGCPREADSV